MNRVSAEVVLDGAVGSYDKRYSYFVPDELFEKAKVGTRVTVPFGNGNIKKQGLIISLSKSEDNPKTKYILGVTDEIPILNDEMIKLCLYMKERFFCTYFDAVHTILPTGLNYRLEEFYAINEEFCTVNALDGDEKAVFDFIRENESVSGKKIKSDFENAKEILLSLKEKGAVSVCSEPIKAMGDKTAKYVRLIDEDFDTFSLTERQKEIADVIKSVGTVSVKELIYFTGVTMSVITALSKKNVIEVFEKQVFRIPYKVSKNKNNEKIVLNTEQEKAFNKLLCDMNSGKPSASLLYGVTGSGKTQVYLKLVEQAVNDKKDVIVMVPEISLTPQLIELFTSRFGNKIAVFHSNMSLGQRMDEYNRIKNGSATIAIGTRSACFAPCNNLGLIIMDEEQEHSYKSEKSPRFNAKDIAKFRANYHNCLLLLASATPSLESYSLALSDRYGLCELSTRYNNAKLPNVHIADMRKELSEGNKSNISRLLASKIEERLNDKKQVIILLNRRGHNTHISCPACGYVATCKECSVSLTYHSANKRMMCHYCGYSESIPTKCPECGNEYLSFQGAGTQKLQEELSLLFPTAKILRLDADTTLSRDSFSTSLKAFADKEYDIMIGTQMVAKGLDFPSVDLVGVIGADRAFYSDDYRGFERTFSLLTQVIGRAGRSGGNSEAVIQTQNITDSVIPLSASQDYKSFYEEEILTRKLMIYPPFCDLCMIVVSSMDKELANGTSKEILHSLIKKTDSEYNDVKLTVLGPMPAAVIKVSGKYRYRMIIKCKNNKRFRELIRETINIRKKKDLSVFVDMNPETII